VDSHMFIKVTVKDLSGMKEQKLNYRVNESEVIFNETYHRTK